MVKKRKKDAGLEYMLSLGFYPAKTISGIEEQIAAVSDRKTAREFIEIFDKRADGMIENDKFYSLKNKDYNVSLALTSAFDSDILRRACNWIAEHKDYFGKTILEVGCDCGVMTCFLAQMFPESMITAIDRCQEAVTNASRLAKERGIKNIVFLACDLDDIKGSFDTVFSMRTAHENYKADEDIVNDLSEQAEIFKESLMPYTNTLSRLVSNDGQLITIERIGRNALLEG